MDYSQLSNEELMRLVEQEKAQQEPVAPETVPIDYSGLSDAEVLRLAKQEQEAQAAPQLQEGEMDTTPPPTAQKPLQGTVQQKTWLDDAGKAVGDVANSGFGILARTLQLPTGAIGNAFDTAAQAVGTIGNEVAKDPGAAGLEVLRTLNALDPIGGAVDQLFNIGGTPDTSVKENINKWLGGRPNEISDTQQAALFGIGNSVGDFAKGIASIPADVGNTINWLATGDNKGPFLPSMTGDVLSPQEREYVNQAVSKEQLAAGLGALEPYLLPIPSVGRAGELAEGAGNFIRKTGQGVRATAKADANLIRQFQRNNLKNPYSANTKVELKDAIWRQNQGQRLENAGDKVGLFGAKVKNSVNNPLVGMGLEAAAGMATEPQGTSVSERAQSRLGQAAITGAATGVGYAGKVIHEAGKIENLMGALQINKETAETIYKAGKYNEAMKLAGELKKSIKQGDSGLAPTQTAAFKDYNIVGSKPAALEDLTKRLGLTRKEALKVYNAANKLQQTRASVSYNERQLIDAAVNKMLQRPLAPFPGARTKNLRVLGGNKGLETVKAMVVVKQARRLANLAGITPRQARNVVAGLRVPLEDFGGGPLFSWFDALQSKFGLLSTGNLLTAVPAERGLPIMRALIKHWPGRKEMNVTGMKQLNQIQDNMILRGLATGWASKAPRFIKGPITDLKSFFSNAVKDGTLYKVMRQDYTGLKPNEIKMLQETADELADFNNTKIIPVLRKLYDTPEFDALRLEDFERGLSYRAEAIFNRTFTPDEIAALAKQTFDDYKAGTVSIDDAKDMGAFVEYDAHHVTNSQNGKQFYRLNLTRLKSELSPTQYAKLLDEHGIGELNANGQIDNPIVALGYGDYIDDVTNHFNTASKVYKDKFPFLYDRKGKFRTDLVDTPQENMTQIVADLRHDSKLDPSQRWNMYQGQAALVDQLVSLTGIKKSALNEMFHKEILSGNVKLQDKAWSKFVASMQHRNGKLIMQNVDPFSGYQRQIADLSKKVHVEPIINEIRAAKVKIKDELANLNSQPIPKGERGRERIKTRLNQELEWYDELDDMYRNVPSKLDATITQMVSSLPDTPFGRALKHEAKVFGDRYVGLQSMLKLGGNVTAGLINVIESWHGLAPQSVGHIDSVLMDMLNDIRKSGLNPRKFLENIALEAKDNPAVFMITGKTRDELEAVLASGKTGKALGGTTAHDLSGLSDSAFGGSDRFFGNRTLGAARDALMYPFSTGTDLNLLLSYRYLKRLGERGGKSGAQLEEWVTMMMTEHKVLPDLDKIPLTSRNNAAKVALVFLGYLNRVADHAKGYYSTALKNPSPTNITRAMMFDLAPGLMLGAKSSISLGLASRAVDTVTAFQSLGTDSEQVGSVDRLKVSDNRWERIAGKGLLGEAGLDVSNLMTRDPLQLWGITEFLPISETERLVQTSNDIYRAAQMRFDADPTNDRASTDIILSDLGNTVRDVSVAANRVSKGLDIFNTGQVRDRKGNKIVDVAAPRSLDSAKEGALQAIGITNAKAQDEGTAARIVRNDAAKAATDAKFFKKHIEQGVRDVADIARSNLPSAEIKARINEKASYMFAPLIKGLEENSLSEHDYEAMFMDAAEGMNKTALQRAFEALPTSSQLKLLSDPRTRKLFQRFKTREQIEADKAQEAEDEAVIHAAPAAVGDSEQDILNHPAIDVFGNYSNGGQ